MQYHYSLVILQFNAERLLLLRAYTWGVVTITEQAIVLVTLHNNWVEPLDVLVSITKSKNYAFLNIGRDSGLTYPSNSSQEHQVSLKT